MKNDRCRSGQRNLFHPVILGHLAQKQHQWINLLVLTQHPLATLKMQRLIPRKNPLPSIADVSEQQVMDPKTLLACCRCAKEFIHEHDLSDGDDTGISIARILNHRSRILEQLGEMTDAAKEKTWAKYLLRLVNVLHVVCNLTQGRCSPPKA